jgi:hypothetical protein
MTDFCSPIIASYYAKHNLNNKALLISVTIMAILSILKTIQMISVVLLSPTTTTFLLHPMDQGDTAAFKTYYVQFIMTYLVPGLDNENKSNMKQPWNDLKKKIGGGGGLLITLPGMEQSDYKKNIFGTWRALPLKCVHDFKGFNTAAEGIH